MSEQKCIDSFIEFLDQEWRIGKRPHSYPVALKGESANWAKTLPDGKNWVVNGIQDALANYHWKPAGNYAENFTILKKHSDGIKEALSQNDNHAVKNEAEKILIWGGLRYRSPESWKWIESCASENKLCEKIKRSIGLLLHQDSDLKSFDGKDLMMNSAITKVISLADPNNHLIIYDGRVGGALGYFVQAFKIEQEIDVIDKRLVFRWGPDSKEKVKGENRRNPSSNLLKFANLYESKKNKHLQHMKHAEMMRSASYIVSQVAKKNSVSARDIEAALFMWGYDVRSDNRYLDKIN